MNDEQPEYMRWTAEQLSDEVESQIEQSRELLTAIQQASEMEADLQLILTKLGGLHRYSVRGFRHSTRLVSIDESNEVAPIFMSWLGAATYGKNIQTEELKGVSRMVQKLKDRLHEISKTEPAIDQA